MTVFSGVPVLLLLTALIVASMTSLPALQGAAINQLFGVQNVSRVMGFSYFFKLPFIFGAAPLTGLVFDTMGGYVVPFLGFAVGFAATSVVFILLSAMNSRRVTSVTSLAA